MENKLKVWLEDIFICICEIETFLPEKNNFFEFQKDKKGKKAIERNIEIIGEALNRILKVEPNFPIENARKIVDTRNRISHAYDSISDDIIWSIALKSLPDLKVQIEELLKT